MMANSTSSLVKRLHTELPPCYFISSIDVKFPVAHFQCAAVLKGTSLASTLSATRPSKAKSV